MKRWTGNVMNLKHFHDFYYLEALRANITMAKSSNPDNQYRKGFEKLEEDVEKAYETLCERMALHIYVYLWVAALGEAVYADENCEQRIAEQYGGWNEREALSYFPSDENMNVVKAIYEQDWQGGGYGGDAWYSIVEGMEMYNQVPHAAFIDHAVDLEHNGGNVFDKTSGDTCGLDCYAIGYGNDRLKQFLNVKFSNDILNNVSYRSWGDTHTLRVEVSMKVYDLIVRYSNVVEKVKAVDFLEPKLEWLAPYSVDWDYNEFTLEDANGGAKCEWCGDHIDPEWCHNFNDEMICDYCYENKVSGCEKCGEDVLTNDTQEVYSGNHNEIWCDDCVANNAVECEDCGCLVDEEYNTIRTEDDYTICLDCAEKMLCEECDEYHYHIDEHMKDYHTEEDETIELPVDSDGIFSAFAMEVA